jgi:CHAT domain-containing protein
MSYTSVIKSSIMCMWLIIFTFLFSIIKAYCSETEQVILQKRAIQKIERFIDHYRKTGEYQSLMPELIEADNDLSINYNHFIKKGNLEQAVLCLIKRGDIGRMRNEWPQALSLYQKAYELAKQIGNKPYQAKALTGQARTYLHGLRDYGSALTKIDEATELSTTIEDKNYLFDALDFKAQIQIYRGELIAAFDTISRAFSVVETLNNETSLFFAYLNRAGLYQEMGKKCNYQTYFNSCYEALILSKADYEKALTLANKLEYRGLAKSVHGFLNTLKIRIQALDSQKSYHTMLTKSDIFHPKKPGDVLVQEKFIAGKNQIFPIRIMQFVHDLKESAGQDDPRSSYIEGLFHEMAGNNDAALISYLKAVDNLEVDRRNLRDEKSRGTFLEDKIEFYYTPILHLLERNRYSEAFKLLERSKARAMTEVVASKHLVLSNNKEQALYGENMKIRTHIALLQKELYELRSSDQKKDKEIDLKEKEIQELEEQKKSLLDRMAKEASKLQELTVSKLVSLEELQKDMKKQSYEVLQYLVLPSQVIVWHIGSDTMHVRSVFLPRPELKKKVEALRKSLVDSNITFDERVAREMFLYLIQPVLKWITTDHVVIIAHEDLHYIPFQVFRNPSDKVYVGERFQLSYAPNATILTALEKRPNINKETLLAAADPDIIDAPDEVDTIADFYPYRHKVVNEFLVKESDLKKWVSDYTIVHLSVHGKFRAEEPLLSSLKLRKGDGDDGRLTAAEIFGLPLEKTYLVVLSACETGISEATHANEILGMMRALIYAGADALILSQWKVDSASTALWMETFYREAQSKPLSEAARLALIKVKAHPQYGHPYYWGAFMMVGK